jgi:excisionase family DNA binding protein
MSEKMLELIKSLFGVEVDVLETTKFYKVNGIGRQIIWEGFRLYTSYDVIIPKKTGRIQVRNTEIATHGNDNTIFAKDEFGILVREYHKLERSRKGNGRNPNAKLENDFNNKLIELLQTTDNHNLNQGLLIGILQEMNEKIISLQAEIREMAENAVPKPEVDDIINVQEAMDFLGFKKSTIYTKVNRGEIPHMKRGKRLYFSISELKKYLRDGKRLTNEEVKEFTDRYLNG